MYGILLQGDHATLPDAELQALLAVHGGAVVASPTERVRLVDEPAGLEHHVQAWGWGEHWGDAPCTEDGIQELAALVARRADGRGSAAVVSQRYGQGKTALSVATERRLGAALADAGHSIDLAAPDVTIYAWLGDGRIHAGRLMGARREGHQDRVTERRAHFSPVGLHPRRAGSLVHLARVPPGGRIIDPFCGTGGIVLEAALMGYDVLASDLDPLMVQGTLTTLTDAAPEPLDADVFQADIGAVPGLVEGIQGIVTDLPYGGASSTHDEGIAELYVRALEAFKTMLPPGGYAVVGHAQPELLDPEPRGLRLVERHSEFVHRSLTRHYAVYQRLRAG